MPNLFDRRGLLAGLAGGLACGVLGRGARARPAQGLAILGAPTGATITLARVVASGGLAAAAPGATFRLWRETDELRAGIVSGSTGLFSTPIHVPANLANRGMPLRLLCILGMGHLFIVTADEGIASFADLKGKPMLGFFRHDMPDLVFRACAQAEGIDPDKDLDMTYVQSGMEAAQMLAAGRGRTAILSEPAATAAIMMAAHQGRTLRRAVGLVDVWGKHHGRARIPMVGIAVRASLAEDSPEVIAALRSGLPAARDWVFANRAEAAALAESSMQIRPQVFEKALDHFNIEIASARAMKDEIQAFYEVILKSSPEALGGRLPSDDFYLDL